MNIHEYQARAILRRHGVSVPPDGVASTEEEAVEIAGEFGGSVVIKAQVHAGGRGKAGGVKLATDAEEAGAAAAAILGMTIKGLVVEKVLIAPAIDIATEAYVGIVLDRESQRAVLMVSPEGGVDIEQVAAERPEAIHTRSIDPRYGLLSHQAMGLSFALFDDIERVRACAKLIRQLYNAYESVDATLAEINPLVTTRDGELLAIDAKMNIDDNALFRLPEIAAMRDEAAEAPSERAAREAGLTYIQLDGNVGCVVNGAGLAMATMDLVKHYGGNPANFLDIGGSSNPEKVVAALRIITADPNVKSILFNIFGGITRCDDVANGIVAAAGQIDIDVPITIRLTGTNEEEAVEILDAHGFDALVDMDEAVQKAVARV